MYFMGTSKKDHKNLKGFVSGIVIGSLAAISSGCYDSYTYTSPSRIRTTTVHQRPVRYHSAPSRSYHRPPVRHHSPRPGYRSPCHQFHNPTNNPRINRYYHQFHPSIYRRR